MPEVGLHSRATEYVVVVRIVHLVACGFPSDVFSTALAALAFLCLKTIAAGYSIGLRAKPNLTKDKCSMLGAARLVPKADGWLAKLDSGLSIRVTGNVAGKRSATGGNLWR